MSNTKALLLALSLALSATAVPAVPESPPQTNQHPYLPLQAQELERVGKWQEALNVWEKWDIRLDCPVDDRPSQRIYHMAICLHHLGQTKQAAFLCMQDTFHNGFAAPCTALLLLEFYQAAGQVGDLRQIIENYENETFSNYQQKGNLNNQTTKDLQKNLPTHTIHQALDIIHLKKNRNISELITIAQSSAWASCNTTDSREFERNWRCRLAADALTELGDDSSLAIKNELLEPKANISWLIYALGRSKSTNALPTPTLTTCASNEQSYNTINYIYAMSMHGEDGRKVILQIRESDEFEKRSIANKAKEFLNTPEKFSSPVPNQKITVPRNTQLLKSYTIQRHQR